MNKTDNAADVEDFEEWYDSEVKDRLKAIGAACEARNLPFIALTGMDNAGSFGTILALPEGASFFFQVIHAAIRAAQGPGVNFDDLATFVMRHASKHGHSSMILKQLGIGYGPGLSAEGQMAAICIAPGRCDQPAEPEN